VSARLRALLPLFFAFCLVMAGCAQPTAVPTPAPTPVPTTAPTEKPAEAALLCADAKPDAISAYREGVALAGSGDQTAAEERFRAAIAADETFCDAYDNLSGLLRAQDRLDEAVALLESSLAVKPDNPAALANLGRLYTMLGNPDKAIDPYLKLSELQPERADGPYGVGAAYYIMGEYQLAAISLVRAEQIMAAQNSSHLAEVRYLLGMSLLGSNQPDSALPYLAQAYRQMPDDPGLNYGLGMCYLYGNKKDVKLAGDFIRRAQELGMQVPEETLADLRAAETP